MMKTKNILLTVAFMACGIGAMAQDVTVLHMKNGTTKRYTNGVKESTSIDFYEHTFGNSFSPDYTTTHENGYSVDWGVNYVTRLNDEDFVGLFWEDKVPANFQAKHGVCFGTKAGLTVDNCEQKVYATDTTVTVGRNTGNLSQLTNDHTHYMWIGPKKEINMTMFLEHITFTTTDTLNYIMTPLEKGQTYYYRFFSEGQVIEGGQQKTVVFYDDEKSFRVPRVMDDFEYYPYPQGTKEAVEAFATAAHFSNIPTWKQMEPLWNKWRATDEGKSIDLSADITTEEFDDGTGYRLNRIPDEFYTWMANREIVIDPFDWAEINKAWDSSIIDSIYLATCDSVTNVDEKWGVPGEKYARFSPSWPTTNYKVTYRSNETVPGVRYKLQINFAPETDADADSVSLRPVRVRISVSSGSHSGTNADVLTLNPETGKKSNIIVPTTEATPFVVDSYIMDGLGADLILETYTSNNEIRKGLYNRIMRIAEIRLTPIKEE